MQVVALASQCFLVLTHNCRSLGELLPLLESVAKAAGTEPALRAGTWQGTGPGQDSSPDSCTAGPSDTSTSLGKRAGSSSSSSSSDSDDDADFESYAASR
jgi:hypothetical protein